MLQQCFYDFSNKKVHILGSCGTLMSGICHLALGKGLTIEGSDSDPSPPMSDLLPDFCQYLLEEKKYLDADCVILGNIFHFDHPIVEQLRLKNIPIFSSMDFLQALLPSSSECIAVCGTHGKSTTSSLLTWILEVAGFEPSYLIGACPQNFKNNGRYVEKSKYFIIEADEYDISCFDKRSKMQALWPDHILLGTIEFDHADIFRDQQEVLQAFKYFFRRLHPAGTFFTTSPLLEDFDCFKQKELVSPEDFNIVYDQGQLYFQSEVIYNQMRLFGPNEKNLTLAIAMAKKLGIKNSTIKKALETFKGVTRRSEHYSIKGIDFWVDFAHHPGAIEAFLRTFSQDRPLAVMIEKASRSMSQGIFDDQLFQLEKKFPFAFFEYVKKNHLSKKRLENFQKYCFENRRVGIIMTNHPFSWSQIQCVFSMLNQEA